MDAGKEAIKEARCGCGRCSIALRGEPDKVYACACTECQRTTGSVFAYRAMYHKTAIVSSQGKTRVWHRPDGPGSWIENVACDHCGTVVYQSGAKIRDKVSVSVGCFSDPAFAPPAAIYFGSRSHAWLETDIPLVG